LKANANPPMKTTVEIAPTRSRVRGAANHALKVVPAVSEMSSGSLMGR
jgi:hypothetical protein